MKELSAYELEAASGELLPARETLAFYYNNVAKIYAYNAATNIADHSSYVTQSASASQSITVSQYQ